MADGRGRPAAPRASRPPPLLLLLLALLISRPAAVTAGCPASCSCQQDAVVCSDTALTANMTELDLSNNNFERIPPDLYKTFPSIIKLDLSHNRIGKVPANAFRRLRLTSLSLAWNEIEALAPEAMHGMLRLTELDLSNNRLSELSEQSLRPLRRLEELLLDRNSFSIVPSKALKTLTRLKALGLGGNQLTELPENVLNTLEKLQVLNMKNNYLQDMDDEAFAGLSQLGALELEGNLLTDIPKAIGRLTAIRSIQLSGNRLTYVREGVLQRAPSLEMLELGGNPILTVDRDAFSNLPRLKELKLSGVKELTMFPNLNGTGQLLDLRVYGSRLTAVPDDLCSISPHLRRIYLPSNNLRSLPRLDQCTDLRLLDVSYNAIESIAGQLFRYQDQLHDLLLRDNKISDLPGDTFVGLTGLLILDLRDNRIANIADDAFVPLIRLQRLNLNNNRFPRLPHRGLEHVIHLHCSNMLELREFPEPEQLPQLHTVEVSYAYHCCQFNGRKAPRNESLDQIQEKVIFASADQLGMLGGELLWSEVSLDNLTLEDYIDTDDSSPLDFEFESPSDTPPADIRCSPSPSPFMPCEDLFDWWTLRCGVWVVFLLALLGNGTVVFVLVFARSKMDVPRFLVCNLAAADFFMGVYLGFLAVVDASTLGEFRKYAIPWQMSVGCKLAGFLGVLSSELSVFTLAVITMERNYAITHAMHLNKRLSIKHASYIMASGWLFALVMATLPLVGVSDYRRFAVCLPFQTAGAGTGYVVLLMFFNGLAFTILMGCYWKMYCAIRGSQAWNSNDSRIAKRMALLVFTDFLCWAPIAFFAVTAAFGVRLIGLSGAKVFTVFILPFNSCCNPFLYAIMTKQFKKDCVMICKAIEESRVTRGIGRCRHSSNFSNRHTPANTNSLADRASKESKDSAQCSCSQRLLHEPLKQPARSRWETFRALWCPAQPKDNLDSSNDYAYQIAEIQKNQEKNKRNASLSSDNFSSSRSDSLRAQNGVHRFVPNRRRNSWTVTRKPSQDSNLSSSRNDSSATAGSNTTQSWRLSRSSVSSDMSSTALQRGQGSLHKSNLADGTERAGSLRGHPLRPAVARQNSGIPLAHPQGHTHNIHHPHNLHHGLHHQHPLLKQASSSILKPKPKLTRQIAFSDEAAAAAAAAVATGGGTQTPGRHHESGCPLHCAEPPAPRRHSRFHNIYSKLTESSQEESSGIDDGVALDDSENGAVGGAVGGPLPGAVGGMPAQVKVEGRNGGLTVAFVPRKLSTISSQSYSLQRDSHNNLTQVSPEKEPVVLVAEAAGSRPGAGAGAESSQSPPLMLPASSLAASLNVAIGKAHSVGDVRQLAARPRVFSSDTCLPHVSRAQDVAPAIPAANPPQAPSPHGIESCLAGDEGFDDIDDADEDDVIVMGGGAPNRSGGEQAVPLLWGEDRAASPPTPRDSPSPSPSPDPGPTVDV